MQVVRIHLIVGYAILHHRTVHARIILQQVTIRSTFHPEDEVRTRRVRTTGVVHCYTVTKVYLGRRGIPIQRPCADGATRYRAASFADAALGAAQQVQAAGLHVRTTAVGTVRTAQVLHTRAVAH